MKKWNCLIGLFLLAFGSLLAQDFQERELETSIEEVTVYLDGAYIKRTGKTKIPAGNSILKIRSLSPYLDDKSIQVKANGDFTVLSVNHKMDFLTPLEKDQIQQGLLARVKEIDAEIVEKNAQIEVLSGQESLLNANQKIGGTSQATSMTQLKTALDFYEKELSAIKMGKIALQKDISLLEVEKGKITNEISESTEKEELPGSVIEVRISSDREVSGDFVVNYLVANAGWYPKYDVRVESISQPMLLKYKADIYQNTGVDWANVKLKLSNGAPNQSGVMPALEPWKLNYARNTVINGKPIRNVSRVRGKVLDSSGLPLPGANVVVDGSTIGTVTDFDGNYDLTLPSNASSLNVSYIGYVSQQIPISSDIINVVMQEDNVALEEVVVTAYGSSFEKNDMMAEMAAPMQAEEVMTITMENQTTVEFEVDRPYSVKSNGEMLTVDLSNYDIEAEYVYYAVPKVDKDAFLVAKITDWNQYNLLEGEANLYFEDTYVGRSIMDAKSLKDTISISLGRDKSIVLGREKANELAKSKTFGSSQQDTRFFDIKIRNNKSQPISLMVLDQIPVSVVNDITVSVLDLSNGSLDKETGKVTWKLDLGPNEQKKLKLGYEVKYPKRESVILE